MMKPLKLGVERLFANPGAVFSLPPALLRGLVPLMVLAIGITAMVMMFSWRDQSAYKPVFGAREKVGLADMMAALDAEKVPYRLHPDTGQVLVPDAMLGKVRMMLAAKGVTAQLPAGLELMDRNDPLGVSQFVQDVRFRRGLEGELAQSIQTLDAISSARVHLSIAKSSSFVVGDGDKSSASVVVALKPGQTLGNEQIAAIMNMVAGSVASLAPQRVSLMDQGGNFLSAHVDLSEGFDASGSGSGSGAARRFSDEARRSAHDLLAPVLGDDNFKLSVTADVDNDRVEETQEKYGEAPKITSEATRDEQDRTRAAFGIPGSLSNRPVSPPAAGGAAPDEAGSGRKNATTRQYAYDRSVMQIKRSRGRLKKLSVAVVLNSSAAPDAKAGWSTEEVAKIDGILRNGLGIDAQRGDKLVVSALPFPPHAVAVPWWQERDNQIDIGSWLVYALGTVLAFMMIVRPAMKLLTTSLASTPLGLAGTPMSTPLSPATRQADADRRRADPSLPAPAGEPMALGAPGSADMLVPGGMAMVPLLANYELPPHGSPVDVMVDHLKVLASKEPERVAEVVKQWVQKHGRAE